LIWRAAFLTHELIGSREFQMEARVFFRVITEGKTKGEEL